MDKTRIDKWLWAARYYKTRSQASKACDAGHININGATAKPATQVKVGDRLDALTPRGRLDLEVIAIGDKRGPASVAQTLYIDHTPPEPKPESPLEIRERGKGRPTKRDRRRQDKLRDDWES